MIAFKRHFVLTNKQIAAGIGVSENMAWKICNGEVEADKYGVLLTAYMESVRAGKIREAEMMIAFYKSF